METRYAAALVCLPGAVGGIWVLWHRRAPDGWDEDIEGPLDVDLAMRLAAVAPRSLLGVDEEGVAPAADRPDAHPQGRHAAPEASDEPEYSQQS